MLWGTTKPHGPHSRSGWPAGLTCIFPEDSSISGAFGLPLAGSQMLGCGFDFCGASCKAPRPPIPMYRCGKFPRLSKRLNSAERASEVQQAVRREERGPGRKGSQREKTALLFTSSFVRASFFFFSFLFPAKTQQQQEQTWSTWQGQEGTWTLLQIFSLLTSWASALCEICKK